MTDPTRAPSPSTVPPGQTREAAGLALDAAAMGIEGIELIDGLLKALGGAAGPGHAAAIVRAGAVIAELYIGPLHAMHDEALLLCDAPDAGGAA